MPVLRVAVVVALAAGVVVLARAYRSWTARVRSEQPAHPLVPERLRAGASRTWVVFTTPYCASCGPVEERLRSAEPSSRVVRVDATVEPVLAGAFGVRQAPTAVLADAEGRVQVRLVGPEAVEQWAGAHGGTRQGGSGSSR